MWNINYSCHILLLRLENAVIENEDNKLDTNNDDSKNGSTSSHNKWEKSGLFTS